MESLLINIACYVSQSIYDAVIHNIVNIIGFEHKGR